MTICNHPSPMFILGYMYPWFSDHICIPDVLISIYAPVILLAGIAKHWYPFSETTSSTAEFLSSKTQESGADETILSSIEILCKIGGYLVLFSIGIKLIENITVIPDPIRLGLIGIMEMTTGIRAFAGIKDWKIGYIGSVAILTFGGLSGLFQTKSVLENKKKAGLSIRPYIFWKSAHAILSAGLAYLLCSNN